MGSLTDIYDQISAGDAALLEKQAAMIKQAEEEDSAGRIMARGFADELHKLAQGPMAITGQRVTGAGASDPAVQRRSAPGGQMAALSRGLPKPPTPKAPKSSVTMGAVRQVKPSPAGQKTETPIPRQTYAGR